MRTCSRITAALAFATFLFHWSLPAQSEELPFQPVATGSGPLLFFVQPENESKSTVPVQYLFDPTSHKKPQALWRGPRPTPEPIARLKPDVVLMTRNAHSFLLNLKEGKTTKLLPTENQTKVISVSNGKIFFTERLVPNRPLEDNFRPRDLLYILDTRKQAKAAKLAKVEIERILFEDEKAFWVVTSGKDRKLSRITKDGKIEEIISFNTHWVAPLTRCVFSPKKKYLALTLQHNEHDFHQERELVVIDLKRKTIILVQERIKDLFPTDSAPPWLPVHWLDDNKLCYGMFKQVVVDLSKEKHLTDKPIFQVLQKLPKPSDPKPSDPKRRTKGFFDLEWGLVYFLGEDDPVANVLNERGSKASSLAVCPKGEWAAFTSPTDSKTYLVDGRRKQKRILISGACFDMLWLPSVTK